MTITTDLASGKGIVGDPAALRAELLEAEYLLAQAWELLEHAQPAQRDEQPVMWQVSQIDFRERYMDFITLDI